MLINDSVNIGAVLVAVPDAFRIDNDDRAFSTSVKASRLIDPGLPGSVNPEFLAALLGVVPHRACIMVLTTGFVLPPVDAEENMALVVGHQGGFEESAKFYL